MKPRTPTCVRTLLVTAAAALAAAGCAGDRAATDRAGPARITGRVVADRLPPDARVEVFRDDGDGPPVPVAGVSVPLDGLGRFETPALVPGRYVVVMRSREAPPSSGTAVVPSRPEVEMRIVAPGAGTSVVLESPAGAPSVRTCRITPDRPGRGVPDRRDVVLGPGAQVRISGLAPGLWHLDVLPDGATADFEIPAGETVQRWIVDPPSFPALGGVLEGTVLRTRGEPALGAAVTARACDGAGSAVRAWGRLAPVGPDGSYRIDRLEPGAAYVRVERRDAGYAGIPAPALVRISPPAAAQQGFTVGP